MKRNLLSLCVLCALTSTQTIASDLDKSGFYVGGKIGVAEHFDNNANSDYENVFGAFAGYQFNNWFALEAGYIDIPDQSGYEVSAKIDYDLFDDVAIYGRGGFSSFSYVVGFGVQVALTDNLFARLEQSAYGDVDDKIQFEPYPTTTLGFHYTFGDKTPPPPPPVVEPRPVEPEPQPEPEPVVIPVIADITFASDSAEIKEDNAISEISNFMKANPETYVQITAHTDSTGSEAHNLKLSERRAETIKYTLIETGIEEGRISANAKGEEEPIADNKTSEGRALNRRVEIEFH